MSQVIDNASALQSIILEVMNEAGMSPAQLVQKRNRDSETEAQRASRMRTNKFKRDGEKVYPSNKPGYQTPSQRHKDIFGRESYDLLKLGRGIVSEDDDVEASDGKKDRSQMNRKEKSLHPEPICYIQCDYSMLRDLVAGELLELELNEKKKAKKKKNKSKCNASPGNHRHRGTKETAGSRAGQFAPKTFKGPGSSSIANDPSYQGKVCKDGQKARRGKARFVPPGQERFKKNASGCGRADPSRKNKCALP